MTTLPLGLEAFADVKRLIVVAAHPDDLETIAGGTISLLASRGVVVFSVNCTLGDIGTSDPTLTRCALATIRQAETAEAARILGIAEVFNLGHPDGELMPTLELRAQIARLYRVTQADTLLAFDPWWEGQAHPDHVAAGRAALDAYMPSKMRLYRPEQLRERGAGPGCIQRVFLFGTARQPAIYVDISAVRATKVAACVAHRSQFPQGEESLKWLHEMDAEIGQAAGLAYAEHFARMEVW